MGAISLSTARRLGLVRGFAFEDVGRMETHIPAVGADEHERLQGADVEGLVVPTPSVVGADVAGIPELVETLVKASDEMGHALRGLQRRHIPAAYATGSASNRAGE